MSVTVVEIPRLSRFREDHQGWANRSLDSKTLCTTTDAAGRLLGIADILCRMGLSDRHKIREMMFLSDALLDIAAALEAASDARKEEWNARDRELLKQARKKRNDA